MRVVVFDALFVLQKSLKQKIASKEAERAVVATNETADIETKLIGLRQNREDARAQFAQAQRELNEIDGRRKDIQSQIDEVKTVFFRGDVF
jgi:predicted  nucleic acid-binding Zn-ribbon protein